MKGLLEKGAVTLLGVTGITLVAAPIALSFYLEHEYQQQIARWSQQAGQVNLRVERFDRGWFASTAVTAIDVPTPSAENSAAVTTLRLVHQITHGPLAHDETLVVKPALASIHTTLELPAPLAAPTQHFFGDQAPLSSNAVIGLLGDAVIDVYSPPFTNPSPDGAVDVTWRGLSGHYEIGTAGRTLHFTNNMPSLEIKNDSGHVRMTGISAEGNYQRDEDELWLGDSVMRMNNLAFRDESNPARPQQVALERVSINTNQTRAGELLRISGGARLAKLVANEFELGPGHYQAELRNLHADTFAHLQRELENLQQQGGSPEALQQQVGALFTQTLPDLLKHSPALEVKELKLTTAQGDIDGNLLINFDGSGEPINPQNIFMLLQRLAIEADVSLPAQLARELLINSRYRQISADESPQALALSDVEMRDQARRWAAQQIAQLQAQNILVHQDGHYRSSLRLGDGQLLLNGRPSNNLLGVAMGAR